jgi:uncharacterized protein YdiU (UPF0061 family)
MGMLARHQASHQQESRGPSRMMTGMCFDNSYARLPGIFYQRCEPLPVAAPELLVLNKPLAKQLGMDDSGLMINSDHLTQLFAGNRLPMDAQPLAMAYAGNQFGQFVPELGDDRAILLGEVIDRYQQRRDLQLRGAGRTPFAKDGEGRLPLGPALREYLVSEAMHALGVPTTRALALTTTGEKIDRQGAEPSAVLARVASCHIRVGTFEYFAHRQQHQPLRQLADYSIARIAPELMIDPDPYLALLRLVVGRQAKLVAHWVSLGFVHGVMNTDNMSLAGETLDYGPCAFLDHYDPDAVFNSIDITGRYAYNSQSFAAQWNLARLAEALLILFEGPESQAAARTTQAVQEFQPLYEEHLLNLMRGRLGLEAVMATDRQLIQDLQQLLAQQKVDYHTFFLRLAEDVEGGGITAGLFGADAGDYLNWYQRWHLRLTLTGRSYRQCADAMAAANPMVMPRNHLVEHAIQRAQAGDFSEFHQLLKAVTRPFEMPTDARYLQPPKPEEVLPSTRCGA